MSIKKLRYTYFKLIDKLLTRLEKALYDETFRDIERKCVELEIENEELKNRIYYLEERMGY